MTVTGDKKTSPNPESVERSIPGAKTSFEQESEDSDVDFGDRGAAKHGECTTMTFKAKKGSEVKGHEARWEEMFARLLKFKERHQHCLVPNRFSEDPKLGTWVATQRRQYKTQMVRSSKTTLSRGRIERLNQIGFEWSVKDCVASESWKELFKKFVEFVTNHGHQDIAAEHGELSDWVNTQRQQYELLMTGQPSQLTLDRARLLNTVGFRWKAKPECSNDTSGKGNTKTALRNGKNTEKEMALINQTHTSTLSSTVSYQNDILSLTAICDPKLRPSSSALKQSLDSPGTIEQLMIAHCRRKQQHHISESLMARSQLLLGASTRSALPLHSERPTLPTAKKPCDSVSREKAVSELILNGPITNTTIEQLRLLNQNRLPPLGRNKRSLNLSDFLLRDSFLTAWNLKETCLPPSTQGENKRQKIRK